MAGEQGAPSAAAVVVAARAAAREVPRSAAAWALAHVARPGDAVLILVLMPPPQPAAASGRRPWSFPFFAGGCASAHAAAPAQRSDVSDLCAQMMLTLRDLYDPTKVGLRVRIVAGAGPGAVAAEAKRARASWVVLDRDLKVEETRCMEELQCNIVAVRRSRPKVLRLNLACSTEEAHPEPAAPPPQPEPSAQDEVNEGTVSVTGPAVTTPSCSPNSETPSGSTDDAGASSSVSTSDPGASPLCASPSEEAGICISLKKEEAEDAGASSVPTSSEEPGISPLCASEEAGISLMKKKEEESEDVETSPLSNSANPANSPLCASETDSSSLKKDETTNIDASSVSSSTDPATSPMFASETDISSPETEAFDDSTGASSAASSEPGATTPACASERDMSPLKRETVNVLSDPGSEASAATPQAASAAASPSIQPWMADILQRPGASPRPTPTRRRTPTADALLEKIAKLDLLTEISAVRSRSDLNFRGNVRDVVSLSRTPAPGPPPLCSVCQHKTPVFGKPPRWFSYAELEHATGGFSRANFLAEGGFGSVHRGVLPDGQAIAVKQHRLASSSQGDVEFCSEVEVLSCAQHRNVVMLIGFCVEGKRRLLVYEYICNRSLDTHLYGRHKETLGWAARQKIAVGAARGLRYLHEECRVGCIIHRDMRPNNILVTHDFEPLVGDFGLARWQPDGDMGVDTRVIGTFGYLAPEYAQSGQITEKADVYSFGIVLVELVTGRKAVDINRPKGQQFLTEWARPLLEEHAIDDLIDPRLEDRFCENEVYCMLHAANLCIRRDPHSRPRMSHVLRILEGDMVVESGGCISAPSSDAGSMSRRMLSDRLHYQEQGSPVRSDQRVSAVNRSLETTLRSAWDADEQGLSNRFWYPSAAAADCSQHPR
ncbi:inactive protein kinase SELMODRAFT_444075-like [Triticum dicoccoides]|uniref:inactive protein kinase SELMODRAFT_444075-like n=1 Tax=Triticum dicoccoides TaxID=85692 RepID=UPI0018900E3D|nr:inactive protein kinase SELMODRAFT_444075-like [Triticum dicoccoides]